MADDLAPLSPDWWAARLFKALMQRRSEVDFFNDYYTGDHPLPWLTPQARDDFRRVLRMTRSNYMGLVCDATAERVSVEGVRFAGQQDADQDTWRILQANGMDADLDKAILEALIAGRSYLLVAPNPEDAATPLMWAEHPSQAIVEPDPENRRRMAAGLKLWDDDWTQRVCATLYLPDAVYKFEADRPKSGGLPLHPQWRRRQVGGEAWPAPNPLGTVPLFEVSNNARLLTGGVSELWDVTDVQDRINKTVADRLITQDFGAFPLKWGVAWPEEDAEGNPTPPIEVGRDRMITTEVAETKFGQFDAAPLDPYSAAKREDVKDIASRTRTPAQYLLGEMSNVNGETLRASESGLVSKAVQRSRGYTEGIRPALAALRRLAGLDEVPLADMEVIYADPEYRSEGELTDAVIKQSQAGLLPRRQAREKLGYSVTQIARMEAADTDEAVDPLLERALRPVGESGAPLGG